MRPLIALNRCWAILGVGMFAALACGQSGPTRSRGEPPSEASFVFRDFRTPDAGSPFEDFAAAWPERWPFGPDDARRGVVREIEGTIGKPDGAWGAGARTISSAREELNALAEAAGYSEETSVVLESVGAWVVSAKRGAEGGNRARPYDASMTLEFISGQELRDPRPDAGNGGGEDAAASVAIQTTWFSVYDPQDALGKPLEPVGVVVVMPGLFGTPEGVFSMLHRKLRQRGWVVVSMVAQPSRFTEKITLTLDPGVPDQAVRPAEVLCDRAAECAYAVKAAMAYLDIRRPAMVTLPRAIIGGSAGAMTLPTVVALDPGRYRGAVLIGGGCHFWLMQLTSNYADWIDAVDVKWTREPTDEELRAFEDAYLKFAKLDSFHTAHALHGMPMLVEQGSADLAVPSPLGDVLWERLEKPRRDLFVVGHELLFMQLPGQFPRILDWLDAEVLRRGEPEPGNVPGTQKPPPKE